MKFPRYDLPEEDGAVPTGVFVFNRDGSLNEEATERLQKLIDDGQQILFSAGRSKLMTCRDFYPENSSRPTHEDIVWSWLTAARSRHIRIKDRLLTLEECRVVEEVLELLVGDLQLLKK